MLMCTFKTVLFICCLSTLESEREQWVRVLVSCVFALRWTVMSFNCFLAKMKQAATKWYWNCCVSNCCHDLQLCFRSVWKEITWADWLCLAAACGEKYYIISFANLHCLFSRRKVTFQKSWLGFLPGQEASREKRLLDCQWIELKRFCQKNCVSILFSFISHIICVS